VSSTLTKRQWEVRPSAPIPAASAISLPPTPRLDRSFRPDIQGLRAIAVLLVVTYHAGVPGISGGFVGVDVFLVISGFLITRQLINQATDTGRISLSTFYAKRIRRLLPSALLVILVTVLVARIWGPALQATSVAKDGFFASVYSINYWLALQGVDYQHADASVSPLQHFWSLAVEEQFYLIWPIVLLIVVAVTRGRRARLRPVLLAGVILAIGAASLQQSATVTTTDAPLAYFSLQTRGWELAVGALIAIAIPLLRRAPAVIAAAASWIGLGMILYSAVIFNDATPFPGTSAAVPVGGAALIIAAGLRERPGSVELLLRPRVMQFLGAVSYGWYLWHWPAIVLGPYLFGQAFGWPERLEVSGLALWFAVMSYLALERFNRRKTISRRRWFAIGGSLTAAVAAITLTLSVLSPGSVAGLGAPVVALSSNLTSIQLAATIAGSVDTLQLPQNVEPTLANATTDTPVTTTDGCHVSLQGTKNQPCVFGDTTAKRTIVLFGDSHAEQWFGAVDALAIAEHWRLISWTKAACPVSDVVLPNPQLRREYTECGVWRAKTIRAITKLHPQLVIASQADTVPGPDYSSATWARKTATTLGELRKAAKSVVFVGDTPHPIEDIPTCIAAHLTAVKTCNVPANTSAGRHYLEVRREDVAAAVKKAGVPLLDPTRWFCTATSCPAVIANTIVYRDDSHMTQHFSRALEPLLKSALAKYLSAARK
jgi:peptidoglycan/LPS O-acetylase OafA/YrhL